MVARGELPEPTSAAHLAKLEPLKRLGGKMSKEACQDPEKAKYIGECCGGRRAWGELGADIYIDDKAKRWALGCLLLRRLQGPVALAAAGPASCSCTCTIGACDFDCCAEGNDRGEAAGGARPAQAPERGTRGPILLDSNSICLRCDGRLVSKTQCDLVLSAGLTSRTRSMGARAEHLGWRGLAYSESPQPTSPHVLFTLGQSLIASNELVRAREGSRLEEGVRARIIWAETHTHACIGRE